ncbi:hypothetical protein [Lysinibacillus fusiformis]|uniref:hypothetical protein n=1 Tax=Lysinibacillus fusiformis TaxID=28031 RepID=UPI003D07EC33
MPFDLQVTGAVALESLARRMRETGDRDLMPKLRKALNKADAPLERRVRERLPQYLPDRYARVLARAARFSSRTATQGRVVSVRLVMTAQGAKYPRRVESLDNPGILRHPVFGRTRRIKRHWIHQATSMANPWVEQNVRPGFWSDQVDDMRGEIRHNVIAAMHEVAQQITKG